MNNDTTLPSLPDLITNPERGRPLPTLVDRDNFDRFKELGVIIGEIVRSQSYVVIIFLILVISVKYDWPIWVQNITLILLMFHLIKTCIARILEYLRLKASAEATATLGYLDTEVAPNLSSVVSGTTRARSGKGPASIYYAKLAKGRFGTLPCTKANFEMVRIYIRNYIAESDDPRAMDMRDTDAYRIIDEAAYLTFVPTEFCINLKKLMMDPAIQERFRALNEANFRPGFFPRLFRRAVAFVTRQPVQAPVDPFRAAGA